MPIRGMEVPGHPDLYFQKGEGLVTLDEAQAMKRHEMESPSVPGRRYLTDIRGCEFRMEDIKEWAVWNLANTPPEYLGPVAYIAEEPKVTAFMLVLSSKFQPVRPAGVFSTLQAAVDFLGAGAALPALKELGVED